MQRLRFFSESQTERTILLFQLYATLEMRGCLSVQSILRYVIVESATAGLQVLHRANGEDFWTVHALTKDDVLNLPEVGIEIPVAEFYEDVEFENEDNHSLAILCALNSLVRSHYCPVRNRT